MDLKILNRVMNLWQYRDSQTILTYVSTAIEVDTRRLIEKSLQTGKQVAVPRCVPGTREMEFYRICSLDELSPGTFGVLEPDPEKSTLLTDFSKGLCIVPALSFDFQAIGWAMAKGITIAFWPASAAAPLACAMIAVWSEICLPAATISPSI